MSIAENIKELRESRGLKQSDLAEICGVTDKAVSKWELGAALPRMGAVEKMATYFGVTKSRILDERPDYLAAREKLIETAFPGRKDLAKLLLAAEGSTPSQVELLTRIADTFAEQNRKDGPVLQRGGSDVESD